MIHVQSHTVNGYTFSMWEHLQYLLNVDLRHDPPVYAISIFVSSTENDAGVRVGTFIDTDDRTAFDNALIVYDTLIAEAEFERLRAES